MKKYIFIEDKLKKLKLDTIMDCRTNKKTCEKINNILIEDILSEILKNLIIWDLIKFKIVNKKFLNSINNDEFFKYIFERDFLIKHPKYDLNLSNKEKKFFENMNYKELYKLTYNKFSNNKLELKYKYRYLYFNSNSNIFHPLVIKKLIFPRIISEAVICLTGIIEYICIEILKLANKKNITNITIDILHKIIIINEELNKNENIILNTNKDNIFTDYILCILENINKTSNKNIKIDYESILYIEMVLINIINELKKNTKNKKIINLNDIKALNINILKKNINITIENKISKFISELNNWNIYFEYNNENSQENLHNFLINKIYLKNYENIYISIYNMILLNIEIIEREIGYYEKNNIILLLKNKLNEQKIISKNIDKILDYIQNILNHIKSEDEHKFYKNISNYIINILKENFNNEYESENYYKNIFEFNNEFVNAKYAIQYILNSEIYKETSDFGKECYTKGKILIYDILQYC